MASDSKSNSTVTTPPYNMKSDEEVGRLSTNHYIIKDAMGGLLPAPIDLSAKSLRILDVTTADGTWINEFMKSSCPPSPTHRFIGIDIDPTVFPKNPPPNVTYAIQDINKPWPSEWAESFDLVNQRLTIVGAGPHAQTALHNVSELVKPGGWIQLIEADMVRTVELLETQGAYEPAAQTFFQLLRNVFDFMGVGKDTSAKLAGWLREDGFVEVQEKKFDVKLGATNPDPELAKNGVYSTGIAVDGLVGFGKSLPSTERSVSDEKLDSLKSDVQLELKEKGTIYPFLAVWGQKKSI